MSPGEKNPPGRLVVFLIGRTDRNLETTAVVESKTLKSAPSYADVMPKQKVIRLEQRMLNGSLVNFLVKAYLPDIVVAEATVDVTDILSDGVQKVKRSLFGECRSVLAEFGCSSEFEEDYTVFCISRYEGDPEAYLEEYGERIAQFLKNEDIPLDEEEVKGTLSSHIKYSKDDITIVDWDGAFIFDSQEDFQSNIELFEIANYQLLRSRILDADLDRRLERTLSLLRASKKLTFFRSREVRQVLKEVIEIRTQSLLESEAVEHNIKLIGDWYSARLYSLISRKFYLENWSASIKEKLNTLEDVYAMAAENFSVSYRATLEFLILGGWFVLLLLYVGEFLMYKIFE